MSHVAAARARAEARLGSTGKVTRASTDEGTFNDETLTVTPAPPETIHDDVPASIAPITTRNTDERAGQQLDASEYRIAIPVDRTGIRRGDTWTTLTVDEDGDPDLIGVPLTVVDIEMRSNVVLRRLRCVDTRPSTGRLP